MVDQASLDECLFSEEAVLSDLSEKAKMLFAELCQFECSCLVLHFLHSYSTTLLTADDVAYHLSKPIEIVERDLNTLAQFHLVQTTRVAGVTFYHLTTEPSQLKLVHELCAWQDRWETRVRDVIVLIWGNNSSVTYTAPRRTREFHAPVQSASPTQDRAAVLQLVLEGGKNG